MTKSRDELKHSFRPGAIPTATDFANLIDSLAHIDDIASLAQIDARTKAIEQKVGMPASLALDADGSWQVLKSGVDTLCAFEILAQIDKTKTSPFAAVTHAVAVCGATRSRPSVRQTKSYSRWYWPWILKALVVTALLGAFLLFESTRTLVDLGPLGHLVQVSTTSYTVAGITVVLSLIGIGAVLFFRNRRAITVAWRSNGKWFDPHPTYDLVVRSGCNYGSKAQKVTMECQIKRLWN